MLSTQRARLENLAGQSVAQSQLDEALSRERMAEQDVEQARVARDRARLDLNRATVRAPFAGIVAERVQQAGEFVASGAPLLRLVNDRELEVVARAPLGSADTVAAGATVSLVDGERKTSGTVRAVIPVGDERSRMVELRIALADRSLRVGTPVRVEIAPRSLKAVVTVPRDAVILRQGASYVMRVRADNTAERVAVNLGPGRDNQVQIDGTLRAGDRVIVRGGERLEPGQTVTSSIPVGRCAAWLNGRCPQTSRPHRRCTPRIRRHPRPWWYGSTTARCASDARIRPRPARRTACAVARPAMARCVPIWPTTSSRTTDRQSQCARGRFRKYSTLSR